MLTAAPILCALLATIQVPSSTLGDGFAGSRIRELAGLLDAASGPEGRLSQGSHWPSPFTYGETASGPSSQYNGRVFDPGTGFHDYGARMYWPQIGRFISADSYAGSPADPASLNRYCYVNNNPYKYTDPTGHAPMDGLSRDRQMNAGMEMARVCAGGGSCAPVIAAGVALAGAAAAGAAVALAPEAAVALAPAAPGAADAASRLKDSGQQLSSAGKALLRADPTGSALKEDLVHRAATFMREAAARTGTSFELTGGDGATRTLTQVAGKLNDVAGRYEYIVDGAGKLTHQMFVAGGAINGIPIKP